MYDFDLHNLLQKAFHFQVDQVFSSILVIVFDKIMIQLYIKLRIMLNKIRNKEVH